MAASSLPCRLLSMSNEARLEGSEEGFLVRDGAATMPLDDIQIMAN